MGGICARPAVPENVPLTCYLQAARIGVICRASAVSASRPWPKEPASCRPAAAGSDVAAQIVVMQEREAATFSSLIGSSAIGQQIKVLQGQLDGEQQAAAGKFYQQRQCQLHDEQSCPHEGHGQRQHTAAAQQGHKAAIRAISGSVDSSARFALKSQL